MTPLYPAGREAFKKLVNKVFILCCVRITHSLNYKLAADVQNLLNLFLKMIDGHLDKLLLKI